MDKPVIAKKGPFPIDVEAGKKYFVCVCGKSKKQPFCDGAHSGSEFRPEIYQAAEAKTVYFCGCKHSGKIPLCDGTHKEL